MSADACYAAWAITLERDDMTREEKRGALETLYLEHADGVTRHLMALVRDSDQAADLLNEVFICAFEALDDFDGRSTAATWLHGIAVNVVRNHWAKQRRRRGFLSRWKREKAAATSSEAEAHASLAVRRLYAAVDTLPASLREAFVLVSLEEKTLAEAAALLAVPVSTLHLRVRKANDVLRTLLDAGGATKEEAP